MLNIKILITLLCTTCFSSLFSMKPHNSQHLISIINDYKHDKHYSSHFAFRLSLSKLNALSSQLPEKINDKIQVPLTKLYIDCSVATLIMPNMKNKKIQRKKLSLETIKQDCIMTIRTLHELHSEYKTFRSESPLKKHVDDSRSKREDGLDDHGDVSLKKHTAKLHKYLTKAMYNAEPTALRYFETDKDFVIATQHYLRDLQQFNRQFLLTYNADELPLPKKDDTADRETASPLRKKTKLLHPQPSKTTIKKPAAVKPNWQDEYELLSKQLDQAHFYNQALYYLVIPDQNDFMPNDPKTIAKFLLSAEDAINTLYDSGSPEKESITEFYWGALDLFHICKKNKISQTDYYNTIARDFHRSLKGQKIHDLRQLQWAFNVLSESNKVGILPHFRETYETFLAWKKQCIERE